MIVQSPACSGHRVTGPFGYGTTRLYAVVIRFVQVQIEDIRHPHKSSEQLVRGPRLL
jgi:hypothetical protein